MTYVWIAFAQEGDDPKNYRTDILGIFSTQRLAKDAITTEAPRTGNMQRYTLDEVHGQG